MVRKKRVSTALRLLFVSIIVFPGAALAADLSGTLHHVIEDFVGGPKSELHREFFELEMTDAQGRKKVIRLKPGREAGKKLKTLRTGSVIRVKGSLEGHVLKVGSDTDSGIEILQEASTMSLSGGRKLIALVADFRDAATSCSTTQISQMLFDTTPGARSVHNLYQESSKGAVGWTGDVRGPYPINYSGAGSCDYSSWASALSDAASRDGVNLSQYGHRMYIFPSNTGCGWAGMATLGGGTSYIVSCAFAQAYSHELGHNLGMYHAGTATNGYGDGSDFMGNQGNVPVNAPHRLKMGWTALPPVIVPGAPARYDLAPLGQETAATQILRIKKNDTGDYYFLSYRTRQGLAGILSTTYADRLNIHQHGTGGNTLFVASVGDGQTFTDSVNGFSITQVSHTSTSVNIQISGECVRANPILALTPSAITVKPGDKATFMMELVNRDSSMCASSKFDLSAALPVGMLGSLSPATLSLAPGETGKASLELLTTLDIELGIHPFSASATDLTLSRNVSVMGSVKADLLTLSAPQNLTAGAVQKGIALKWQAPASGAASKYRVFRNGVAVAELNASTLDYTDSVTSGTYVHAIAAVDSSGTMSPSSNEVSTTFSSRRKGNPRN